MCQWLLIYNYCQWQFNDSVISAEIWRAEVSPCWQDHDAKEPNLLITAEFAQLHQGIVEILRYSMENGWKLFETCQFKDFRRTHKEFQVPFIICLALKFFSFNSPRKMSANGTGKRQGPRPRTSSLLCPPPSSSRRTWKVSNCLIPGVFWDGRSWHEWKLGAVLHLELFWGPWWIK